MPVRRGSEGHMTRIARVALAALSIAISVTTFASAASAAPSVLDISERMLRAGDLPGFDPPPLTRVVMLNTLADWAQFSAPERVDAEERRLRATGFVAAARARLLGPSLPGHDAHSMVVQFRTANGAHADFAPTVRMLTPTTGISVGRFTVRGIPGAQGFTTSRPGSVGYDVIFVDGQFLYDEGVVSPDPNGPPTRADLVRAATRMYRRVHGHRAP